MLQTIREYAEELLETKGETQEVRGSHAHYYADLADSRSLGRGHGVPLSQEVMRSRPAWLDWQDMERENLAKALGSLTDRREAEAALQMVLSTWRLWFLRGPLRDGQVWTERVLALDDAKLSPDYGWFLGVAAEYPRFRGDYARARALDEQAILLLRRRGEKFRLGTCIEALASIVESQGDFERARFLHEECLAIGREIDEPSVIAHAINGLGVLAFRQADYVRMAALAEEEVALSRETGAGLSEALASLAEARRRLGQLDSAATLFHEALSIAEDLGEVGTLAECLDGIGDVAADREDLASAVALWAVSRRLLEELGQSPWDPEGAEQGMNAARSALGAEAFEKLRREGEAMSREEAVAKATAIASG
jgi:non-specific serine/threonine protein kinase